MKVVLEISQNQAAIIQDALDLYARIGSGQFWEILKHPQFVCLEYNERIREKLDEVSSEMTKLPKGASLGVIHPELCSASKTAFWIMEHIRYALAPIRYPDGGFRIDFNAPFSVQDEEEIECNVIEDVG